MQEIATVARSSLLPVPIDKETITLLDYEVSQNVAGCQIRGKGIGCQIGDRLVSVESRPHLIGEVDPADLYSYSNYYSQAQKLYSPDRDIVAKLRSIDAAVEFRVF